MKAARVAPGAAAVEAGHGRHRTIVTCAEPAEVTRVVTGTDAIVEAAMTVPGAEAIVAEPAEAIMPGTAHGRRRPRESNLAGT